jgi:hypothetical protein
LFNDLKEWKVELHRPTMITRRSASRSS